MPHVQVHIFLHWVRISPTNIDKITENTCSTATSNKNTSSTIFRYVGACEDHRGSTSEQSDNKLYSLVSWFCDKSKEISVNTNSGNRILRNDHQFYDFVITKG